MSGRHHYFERRQGYHSAVIYVLAPSLQRARETMATHGHKRDWKHLTTTERPIPHDGLCIDGRTATERRAEWVAFMGEDA